MIYDMRSNIAKAIRITSIGVIILGVIGGIVLGNMFPTGISRYDESFNYALCIITIIGTAIFGISMIGFSELIERTFRCNQHLENIDKALKKANTPEPEKIKHSSIPRSTPTPGKNRVTY